MRNYRHLLAICLLVFQFNLLSAQKIVGTVTASSGLQLKNVTVSTANFKYNTITDSLGQYSLNLAAGTYQISFSMIGFKTVVKELVLNQGETISINTSLNKDYENMEDLVMVGTRSRSRSLTNTTLPIDNISALELKSTGQFSLDKALQYRVPSFNTINVPVSDATNLLDPYDIRGLGPSRTLVLINGKRKNLSSLLYLWFSPGRGETGSDLSAIPMEAIKNIEILRDGASAQYGSDAIAGVVNVILKDKFEYSSLTLNGGLTAKGDGAAYSLTLNSGANIGDKGFLNYTIGFNDQNDAVRSGLIDEPTEIATFGGDAITNDAIRRYLAKYPTANNVNGTGNSTAGKFEFNLGLPIGENGQFYSNAAYMFKKSNSRANFRPAYWRIDEGLLHIPVRGGPDYTGSAYGASGSALQNDFIADKAAGLYQGYIGYLPTLEGNLTDYNASFGFKNSFNGWKQDMSITIGGNQLLFEVNNTVNRTMLKASPTNFKPGGYGFHHVIGNMDFSKRITEKLSVAFGTEARKETYEITGGDTASYYREGSNSFPGIDRINAGKFSRYNMGAYADVEMDLSKNFLVNGTVRSEKYSDFGSTFIYKVSASHKLADDKITLRASASSGFRAPTLHQIYTQSTQASFIGGTIVNSGLFNNKSKQAFLLGIPKLKPEKAINYTVGLGLKLSQQFHLTIDYYDITISDRVVYSSSISSDDPTTQLYSILKSADLVSVQFFINGIKTHTSGIDVVANYKKIKLGKGEMDINLAANYTLQNKIIGTPQTPKAILDAGSTILNVQITSLLTEGRPLYKAVLGFDYKINKFMFNLNNTLFGKTAFQDLDNGTKYKSLGVLLNTSNVNDPINSRNIMNDIKQIFTAAVLTDLSAGYELSKKFNLSVNVNNIFNVLPKWNLVSLNTNGQKVLDKADAKSLLEGYLSFSGRYRILGYNGSQFSQLGTTFSASLKMNF
ncbi:MAG: TonB-dependent receptor [Ferruginibacter sp.]